MTSFLLLQGVCVVGYLISLQPSCSHSEVLFGVQMLINVDLGVCYVAMVMFFSARILMTYIHFCFSLSELLAELYVYLGLVFGSSLLGILVSSSFVPLLESALLVLFCFFLLVQLFSIFWKFILSF